MEPQRDILDRRELGFCHSLLNLLSMIIKKKKIINKPLYRGTDKLSG